MNNLWMKYLSYDGDTQVANKPGEVASYGSHGWRERGRLAQGNLLQHFTVFENPGVDK